MIFPEGGNFTPRRRIRAIESLRRRGHATMAERAEKLQHVLAPKPGGVLAALEAAPAEADILMVAHTGLDHLLTLADLWRALPMDKTITMQWWRIDRDEIPDGPRRANRLAVLLVGAHRRLDRRAPLTPPLMHNRNGASPPCEVVTRQFVSATATLS